MRHCGYETRSKECTCLSCINDTCIWSITKLCRLCNYSTLMAIKTYNYPNTDCHFHYSWTDKLKRKEKTSSDKELIYPKVIHMPYE